MEKKPTKTDKVAEAITLLADAIKSLELKMETFTSKEIVPDKVEPVIVEKEKVSSNETDPYMPQEYREIVAERLNDKFKVGISYRHDDGQPIIGFFAFKVWVPVEYSNARKELWDKEGKFEAVPRMRLIEIALGEIGVREWVDKIADNLGHDIMFKVKQENKLVTV